MFIDRPACDAFFHAYLTQLPPEHPHLKEYRETLAKCRAALAEKDKPGGKKGGG